jgi:hypothetical protein
MKASYATYGIIDSDRELLEGIAGLHAGTVCNLPYRGIGVTTSVLTRPIRDVIAGAVEHEKVVERLMQTYTVLPMRFPTVFANQEAVLAMVSQHCDSFRENLRRLHNQVEFGIRVLWPAPAMGRQRMASGVKSETAGWVVPTNSRGVDMGDGRWSQPALRNAQTPGKQYLCERYRQYQCRQVLSEQADQFGRKLDAALSEFVTAKRIRKTAADAFAFDGFYLVNRDKGAAFRWAFAEVRRLEPDFGYLLSGPWPPYNFVTG